MKWVTFGEVADFINGRAFAPEEWSDNGLPIIRIQNLTGSSEVINRFDGEFDEKHLIHRGDILISWSASLGVYRWQGDDAVLNQHIFKVITDGRVVDNGYFFFSALNALSEMAAQVHGATMQHITKAPFESTRLPLPPLREQQRIAVILARADRLRRLRRYALELSEGYLQAVFVEMFGDPARNPKGWKTGSIGDVLDSSQYGTSQKSNSDQRGYPVLGMGNITYSGSLDLTSLACVDLTKAEFESLRLQHGDIIFNRTNSTALVGKTAYWNLHMDAVIASYLVKLRLKQSVRPEYFTALLNSPYYKHLFRTRCKEAIGQSNVSPTLLAEFPAMVPPVSVQQEFAHIVQNYDRLRAQQREALRQAEQLLGALLDRAFRGEL